MKRDIIKINPKGMMNQMDFFKVKNNLLVGQNAFVSGDLFVSGKIISGAGIVDCGSPLDSESSLLEGSHGY